MAKSVEDYIIDFADEEGGGGGRERYRPGAYKVKIVATKVAKSKNQGTIGFEVVFQFQEGRYKGKKITDTLWKSPKAYRRFRSLCEAADIEVPSKLDLRKLGKQLKGSSLYIEVETEKSEGYSPRSRVGFDGFVHPDDYDPELAAEDGDDEDEEDEEEDEDDGDDSDDEEEEDEDEEDEDDEDEEDEPEPPKRKKRASKAKSSSKSKAKPKRKKKVADDEDDDLEELDLEDFE